MKAQLGILVEENEEPNWWAENMVHGWQKVVGIADGVWWFVMKAEMVRQVGPGQRPEVIDDAERHQHTRGMGLWL